MIKSLEVVIALSLLFFFIIYITENYQEPKADIVNLQNKISDLITTKMQNSDFRDILQHNNLDFIYDSLYEEINVDFAIKLCDWIDENCLTKGTIPLNKTKIAYDYYIYDLNKTLSVISWIK